MYNNLTIARFERKMIVTINGAPPTRPRCRRCVAFHNKSPLKNRGRASSVTMLSSPDTHAGYPGILAHTIEPALYLVNTK